MLTTNQPKLTGFDKVEIHFLLLGQVIDGNSIIFNVSLPRLQ